MQKKGGLNADIVVVGAWHGRRGPLRGGNIVHSVQADGRRGVTIDFGRKRTPAARVVIAVGPGSKTFTAQPVTLGNFVQ